MKMDIEKELKDLYEKLEEAVKQDTTISLELKNGKSNITMDGSTLGLFIGVATLEKSILNKYPNHKWVYEIVRKVVDTKDVE